MPTRKYAELYRMHTIWRMEEDLTFHVSQHGVDLEAGLAHMEAVVFINRRTGSESNTWDFSRCEEASKHCEKQCHR